MPTEDRTPIKGNNFRPWEIYCINWRNVQQFVLRSLWKTINLCAYVRDVHINVNLGSFIFNYLYLLFLKKEKNP